MRKKVLLLRDVFIIVLITVFLMEVGLRIFPKIIPPVLLIHFDPALRKAIAKGRFITIDDTFEFNRDDSGPPLRLMKPFTISRMHNFNEPGDVYTTQLDEIGFCNPPETYNQSANIDLVTIGDSFTWCTAVKPEDTWTKHLGNLAGISTLNLGRQGVGLYEYIQIFKGYGAQKKPKIVIMGIYGGNDLRDALKYQDYRKDIEKAYTRVLVSRNRKGSIISRHSYSISIVRSLLKYFNPGTLSSNDKVGLRSDSINFRYNIKFSNESIPFNKENTDKDEVQHAKLLYAKKIDLQVFMDALKTFVELSQQHQFIPVIVYIPSAHTTYADNIIFADPDLLNLMAWFSQEQRTFFKIQSKELGYVFIDLTPSLQSSAKVSGSGNLLYYRLNLHLTKQGHKIVAETIWQNLQNMRLIK